MTFNKKMFLIWGILFGLGVVINLLLILISSAYIFGWLWAGIGNITFLLTTLFFLNIDIVKERNGNFKRRALVLFYSKTFLNLASQLVLGVFLFLINYWFNGSWLNAHQGPINLFSFMAAIALPGIALAISFILKN